MATEEKQLQTTWFPFDHVMAVVDDAADAAKAVGELKAAGFHAEDIQLLHGEEAAERLDVTCQHCNLVKHLTRFLWSFMTVEGLVLSEYQEEGKAGHQVLGVHVHSPKDVEKAQAILKAHHARRIEHFGHLGGLTEVTTY
jgi:hypothetical protein